MNILKKIFEETGLEYESVSVISWYSVSRKPLSEDFIRKFKDKINWSCISRYQKLSENFIREFQNEVYWSFISQYQILSENFIREFKEKVVWEFISIYQKLSEDFIIEFKNEVNWFSISRDQKLSENFIIKFKKIIYWSTISIYQKLSESFISKYKNEVDWLNISKYQKLSEAFISENINKISLPEIVQYQKLSDELFKKIGGKKIRNNWLYKDAKFKKKQVVDSDLYECHNNYFIAYKNIRKDRYSHFNFQYQYLKGGVYECHCDCTDNENSFGLSAWSKEKALEYNDTGIIVKVKIRYEDVGRVVHNGGKIRCFKFEVID